MDTLDRQLAELTNYSPCDVSDALIKLQKTPEGSTARAGYLADLVPFSPIIGRNETMAKIAGTATTIKFLAKDAIPPSIAIENPEEHGFLPGKHWVDHVGQYPPNPHRAGSILLIEQPADQYCAVTGGIMATRMKAVGIKATVVGGRVRDLRELRATGLPIWARATSTVGTNAEAKAGVRDVPISIGGVSVSPGDVIFCDPLEGVVAIPRELLGQVLELMPKLTGDDDDAKEAVVGGMSVTDAFRVYRR
ncbi:Ribonuclease E inhibitor RraA/Dimethylmenaquinone methyltransferase [Penicillium cf. griseofulvum]|uniref:Ribonuclease E inhibitor RraA/Dimethylmenaquinone methyltransferase n=1 Tax=Penicillium cf. griseofulvum TaxID=2972120 RepID=A0A9W9MR52_9EURO|nr:Ribonuclease E inhibitor RraA/Dimethylmenaquinone methyltransferase [Penicillium cf. griseofulvum]KAJ5441080.1 Ribonuclease E inhibitor RraA/Dimethylmenaquinone methyltransferase [Penicillium cf. griseofulvum]KAJ5449127.1 Ribonuclease E inhibitor RraA/Dimethylmenaquinone methyltransferase [Penicillium cf. griseofulvum]